MNYSIVPAEVGDVAAIAEAETQIFSDPWSDSSISGALSGGAGLILAAEDGERLLGYIAVSIAADEAEVLRVAVRPEYRGRGIGRALLKTAVSALASRGARAVFLEVRESNLPARRMYRSAGFAECGRRRKYYRSPPEDAILMMLETQSARP